MYDCPPRLQKLIKELKKHEGIGDFAEILVYVELALFLLEYLDWDDEPITAPWAVLSGTPLNHPNIDNLTKQQKHAIANARLLVPFSSRAAWMTALSKYATFPEGERGYDITEADLNRLDDTLLEPICVPANKRHPERFDVYLKCLEGKLDFKTRDTSYATAGSWHFKVGPELNIGVKLADEHVHLASLPPQSWCLSERPRHPFCLDMEALGQIARQLDKRDDELCKRFVSPGESTSGIIGEWERRWEKIELHAVVAGELGPSRELLTIDGWAHIAGMVASGKSTLATLLAASVIEKNLARSTDEGAVYPPQRLTIVVPDVDTALRLANQLNWWFCQSPENDTPVAVPLLGRTSRDKHRQTLYNSSAYRDAMKRGQPQWAERWLGAVCPLQGALVEGEHEKLDHRNLVPGTEPCGRLYKDGVKSPRAHLCPFFARCPSQQAYFDMPGASIWITTPGAMATATLPGQLSNRRDVRLGDLIYEQSDLVIVDEADTVMEWFDGVYAEKVPLTNGHDGVLNQLDEKTAHHRSSASHHDEWMEAAHNSSVDATKILMQIKLKGGRYEALEKWSRNISFTPYAVFYHVARCVAEGQKNTEYDDLASEAECQARTERTNTIMKWFEEFMKEEPLLPTRLLGQSRRKDKKAELVTELHSICRAISEGGDSTTNTAIRVACQEWVRWAYGEDDKRAIVPELTPEVVEYIGYQLQFALTVRLLDWNTRTVFLEWHRKPPIIEAEQPHRRIPSGLLNVLPLPPEGRQYGAFLAGQSNTSPVLSMFAYTNIGRCYLLNFHRLRSDLDYLPGPNVLALSGTSYLPDSTRFHVGSPQAVLKSEKEARECIAQSTFVYAPRYDEAQHPLIVSGREDKGAALQQLASELCRTPGPGNVLEEYEWLQTRGGETDWQDRSRILMFVNSYEQAQTTRFALERALQTHPSLKYSELKWGVRALQRGDDGSDVYDEINGISRADVENFALTKGKILIAPLSAVGRGVNILNENGKAAFGAVYFLVRPMPHPADATAIAQEVNRRTLDWAQNPEFPAWRADGIEGCARELRKCAGELWRSAERRGGYRSLHRHAELDFEPRHDLAATTAGIIIQAVGRLVRGGVPFRAYFVDAAWAPRAAQRPRQNDSEETSLLVALRERLQSYVAADKVGDALYEPLTQAMRHIDGLDA